MPGLNIGYSNATPYVKYNSKADRWFVRGEEGDAEIAPPTFVADIDNMATGWLRFREGQAPERRIDAELGRTCPAPDDDHKRGFVMMLYSDECFGGAVEFSSASMHVGDAIGTLYAAWLADYADHRGKLPVVRCTGSVARKDKYGTNHRPTLAIIDWVARPAGLPNAPCVDPGEVWDEPKPVPVPIVRTRAARAPAKPRAAVAAGPEVLLDDTIDF